MLWRARFAVWAGVMVLLVGPARGALTSDQFKCQNIVAKQGRVFFKKRFTDLARCQDAINQGHLPTSTDCTLEPKTQQKLDKAEQKLRAKIGSACADSIVASLSFGGQCFGVTTAAALEDCEVQEHQAASDVLITTAYGDDTSTLKLCNGGSKNGVECSVAGDCPSGSCVPYQSARVCDGGGNDGMACAQTSDCPSGACVLSAAQQLCAKSLSKALGKLASKRQTIVQSCKKQVAKDKLPLTDDCVAAGQAKLDAEFSATVDAIRTACPGVVPPTLAFGGACTAQTDTDSVAACGTCSVGKQADELILAQYGSSARGGTALAEKITNTADCVGGPLSRCRANDYLLKNDKIRVVVQDIQRNMFGIGQFGGQIIDGDIVRQIGDPDRDNFEEWSVSLNIESTAHYTSLTVLNDGSDGGPAVIRATGVDDLLDFINPSSVVASFGFLLPPSTDDEDIPTTITTDYILEPGTNYVRVETTVQNTGASVLNIFFGEFINGSGEVEMFQPGYGFGEPLVGTRCPITPENLCNFTAYSGYGDADGVSYGYIHQVPGSSTFSTSGVHIPQLDVEVVLALIGAAGPPFAIQPMGNPGDTMTFTRYFVVGDGSVSAVSDARNEIQCLPTGTLQGTVMTGAIPARRADVAVLGDASKGPGLAALTYNAITHAKTDDNGHYSLTLPAGTYNIAANLESSPYEGSGSTPLLHPVTITAFGSITQDMTLPATGALEVKVVDQGNAPVPAKVSVVGFDPSPDLLNTQSIFGLVHNTTGIFADRTKDAVPFGLTTYDYIGLSGDSGVLPLEPGTYQVVVSHGPEYSVDAQNVTITAGSTQVVNAKVEHVIDTTGFVSADFHVHSIDSPDSQVPHVDRILTMLGEGMDFFTPTDHDYRYDYQPLITSMGAANLLGTATGEEITSFDYGHFNGWPLTIDPSQVNHGGVDFGGAAPDGQDYPSFGNYSLSPASIIAAAHADAPGLSNTVQINHIHSHFGLDGGSGLAIDTGATPPQSLVPAAARRLDPAVANFFTNTFDALEIWIGDDRQGQILTNFLGQNIGDWFNLINQGIVRTGIADSDSHKHAVSPVGFPRNMVASPTDNPALLSGIADTLSDNVNAGRTIGTDGPMVHVTAHAVSTGETGKLELGFPTTISTTDGAVDITVDIQSPTWAEFDRVEYYVNTTTTQVLKPNQQTGSGIITMKRYTVTPDFVQTRGTDFAVSTVAVAGTSSSRLEASTTLSLTGLTQDTWVVVVVKGTDGVSHPLFPMIPNSIKTSTNTTLAQLTDGNLGEDGILALAFANPLFIDVDGGGWTAPGVHFH